MEKGVKRDILNAVLAATAGVVAMKACEIPRDYEVNAIRADLEEQVQMLLEEQDKREKYFCTINDEPDTDQQPTQKEINAVSIDEYEDIKKNYYYCLSVNCQFGYDPIAIAVHTRNSCNESAMLNRYMDKMYANCTAAESIAAPVEKDTFARAKARYAEYRKNYRVSPPQCGEQPDFK